MFTLDEGWSECVNLKILLGLLLAAAMVPGAQAENGTDNEQASCLDDFTARAGEHVTVTEDYVDYILNEDVNPMGHALRTVAFAFELIDPSRDFVRCVTGA